MTMSSSVRKGLKAAAYGSGKTANQVKKELNDEARRRRNKRRNAALDKKERMRSGEPRRKDGDKLVRGSHQSGGARR